MREFHLATAARNDAEIKQQSRTFGGYANFASGSLRCWCYITTKK